MEVVVGPPFSGKGRYVRDEIERREAAGELGLIAVDWTAIYLALFPGVQSHFRDDQLGETGASRAAGAVYDFAVGAVAARELSGFVLSQSPERAIMLADRLDARLLEVVESPDVVAQRAESHMARLKRTVTRAALDVSRPRCRRAGAAYFREQHRLVGRAHEVRRSGRGYRVDSAVKRPFDRALFLRGLTPRGREAVTQLRELGNAQPTPAQVLEFLLKNRVDV